MRLALLFIILIFVLTACQTTPFHQDYEKDFVYGRLMSLATYPNHLIPEFSWADHGCETLASSVSSSVGGGGGGGGGSSSSSTGSPSTPPSGPPACPT